MSTQSLKEIDKRMGISSLTLILFAAGCLALVSTGCSKKSSVVGPTSNPSYTIAQTLSDQAQSTTIAFDGLGFMTGTLGSQSFLPPGKVADFSGFQYLRDNDPTNMGHNTSFVTIVAFNVLHILNTSQINQLVQSAQTQIALINNYAYQRFPLMKAFRRQFEDSLPSGSTGLDKNAVMAYATGLGQLNGEISYNRAKVMSSVLRSLTNSQVVALARLKGLNGVGNWDQNLSDPLANLHLDPDVGVAVMTDASEMYSWYAGSVDADVYFCPEGEGTYFGSFYLKDWPAMGNPNYTINEQLTANAGNLFLAALTDSQKALITGLVDIQRNDLNQIVSRRQDISLQLRQFLAGGAADSATVVSLAGEYGALDGEIVYKFAMHFSQVGQSLSTAQKSRLASLADSLGYLPPPGAFLYSQPIPMPEIENTDFLFGH